MKKFIFCLALVSLLSGLGFVSAPVPENKKPIVVDKFSYAQEIIEYESEEDKTEVETIAQTEIQEDCQECICVCVRGSSKISKSPDRAKICAAIEILDTDMNKSKEDNFNTFDKIVSALKKKGLTEEQITLEYFNCCPSYDYTNGKTLQGYLTDTTFCVQLDNIADLKSYIDVLTENGVTSIYNIEYQLSTLEAEYASALASALENAKTKASTMLGSEDIKLVSIKEEMVFSQNNLCRSYVEGTSTELVGKIEVQARICAEFSCCNCD